MMMDTKNGLYWPDGSHWVNKNGTFFNINLIDFWSSSLDVENMSFLPFIIIIIALYVK